MKKILTLALISFLSVNAMAQRTKTKTAVKAKPVPVVMISNNRVVEASCSECKFAMSHTGCSLAVRIDGKSYLVEGAKLDDYGDAHADHGMCNEVRKAEVTGEIRGNKFVAKSFKLLPVEKSK